jgi:hypothetical protein
LLPQAIQQSRTTPAQWLAYRHYLLSLTGQVKPEDEPEHLLKASIARMKASIAEAKKLKTGQAPEE